MEWDLEFRVQGSGSRVQGLGFRVEGRVWGSGFGVEGGVIVHAHLIVVVHAQVAQRAGRVLLRKGEALKLEVHQRQEGFRR